MDKVQTLKKLSGVDVDYKFSSETNFCGPSITSPHIDESATKEEIEYINSWVCKFFKSVGEHLVWAREEEDDLDGTSEYYGEETETQRQIKALIAQNKKNNKPSPSEPTRKLISLEQTIVDVDYVKENLTQLTVFLDGGFDSPSKLGVMWHFQEGENDCNVSDDVKKELYKIVTPLLDTLHQELEKQGFVFQPRKKEDEVA